MMHDDQASASPPGQDREPRAVAWRQPPDLLALPDDEVHVWRADLDGAAPHAQALGLVLDAGERLRAARFHFERDRSRFVVAHATLRDALARYLGTAPAALRFAAGPQGKPALAREPGQMDLRFNLSHSQGIALWAVARGREVGIDVERVQADLADEQVAARFFAPREVEAIRALPREQRLAAFFDCWTRKEAFVKAMGGGLSVPLDQFEVSVAPGGPAVLLSTRFDPAQASRWTLRALEPGEGYTAALAAGGRGWRLRCWEWRPEAGGARLEDGGRRDG